MANEVKLDLKITVPVSLGPAGDMPDKWAETLIANAQRIYDRLLEVLPDEGEFQSRLAEPANQKWSPMIASGFVSQSGRTQKDIQRAHYKGLAGIYSKFVSNLGKAFATVDGVVAKVFKDKVNNAKDLWAIKVAQGVLRITGDKVRGMVVPQVVYWMTGDFKANKMTKHMELINGGPYDFTKSGLRQQFRTAVLNLLISAGASILRADMDAATIAAQNTRLVDLADSFRDTTVAPVKPFIVGGVATDSLLQYEWDEPSSAFKLHARIVLV